MKWEAVFELDSALKPWRYIFKEIVLLLQIFCRATARDSSPGTTKEGEERWLAPGIIYRPFLLADAALTARCMTTDCSIVPCSNMQIVLRWLLRSSSCVELIHAKSLTLTSPSMCELLIARAGAALPYTSSHVDRHTRGALSPLKYSGVYRNTGVYREFVLLTVIINNTYFNKIINTRA